MKRPTTFLASLTLERSRLVREAYELGNPTHAKPSLPCTTIAATAIGDARLLTKVAKPVSVTT